MNKILTPDCPLCGHPPWLVLIPQQAMCGNEDCNAFLWDMTVTLGYNLAHEHRIDLDKGPDDASTVQD